MNVHYYNNGNATDSDTGNDNGNKNCNGNANDKSHNLQTLTPLFFRIHLLALHGVGQVVERQTEVVVAGVGATVVGGKETAPFELPQAVAPHLTGPVHEAAIDPATCSIDLRSNSMFNGK